jgi:putative FmdB family regulatory protein
MPTYQYACTAPDCGTRFELVQSFTDPAARECPQCNGPVRKVFSAVGVVFKGSGFYRTDSRNGSSSGANGGQAKDAEKTAAAESGTKSDTAAKSTNGSATGSGAGAGAAGGGAGSGAGSKVAASA